VRIALLADVHANLPALEAVLADAARRRADAIWSLGDLTGYGAEPEEVVALARRRSAVTILGNCDRQALVAGGRVPGALPDDVEKRLAFRFAFRSLSAASRRFLEGLPEEARLELGGRAFLLTHASPADREEQVGAATSRTRLGELAELAGADVVLCGHTHRPLLREAAGVLFVNPGSVGRPDDGDPRAGYALLDVRRGRVAVEHRRLRYDVEAAVRAVRERGLPEIFGRMISEAASLERLRRGRGAGRGRGVRPPLDAAPGGGDPRLAAALALARRANGADLGHARQVTRLALALFNGLQPLHGLGPVERFRLQCAALLHDVGWALGGRGHHKASLALILGDDSLGLSEGERLIIGSIARYHRKAFPSARHAHFARLGPEDRRAVAALSALLRLADGLDASHEDRVAALACSVTRREIRLCCSVRGAAGEGGLSLEEKAALCRAVFGRRVVVRWEAIGRGPGSRPGPGEVAKRGRLVE